jgi:hypothetical protein
MDIVQLAEIVRISKEQIEFPEAFKSRQQISFGIGVHQQPIFREGEVQARAQRPRRRDHGRLELPVEGLPVGYGFFFFHAALFAFISRFGLI